MTKPKTLHILAAAVLWGTTGTARAVGLAHVPPLAVGVMRMLIGGLALLAFSLWRGKGGALLNLPRKPLIVAAAGMAGYNIFFFTAVSRAGVAIGTVTTIGSAPIIAGLLGWWFYAERPTRHWILATSCAIGGVVLLALPGRTSEHIDVLGVAFALAAALAYASFSVAGKRLLVGRSPIQVMAAVSALGAALVLPFLYQQDMSWLAQPVGWGGALYLGVVTNAGAYLLYAYGLQATPIGQAVTLGLAEPLTASLLGILWLGEPLTLLTALGMGSLLTGLLILARQPLNATAIAAD